MVTCRRCLLTIPPTAIDPTLGFVACPACDAIFELPGADGAPPPARAAVPMPKGVTVTHRDAGGAGAPYRGGGRGALELTLPLPRWNALPFLLGAMMAYAIAIVPLFMGLQDVPDGTTMVVVMGVTGALVGTGMLYAGLGFALNRRIVVVDPDAIDLRVEPLPWARRRRIATTGLQQLYVHRVVVRSGKQDRTTYHLETIDQDGIHATLAVLESPSQALWLEQELERYLKIEDVAVIPATY